MADLNGVQASDSIKIVGSDPSGVELTPVQSTSFGALHSNLRDGSGNELLGVKTNSLSIPVVLSSEQYTANTTPLYVESFDTKLSELSKSFIVTTNNLSKGTVESPAFLLRNPVDSGKTVFLNTINFSGPGTFRIYFSPTVTLTGTALVPLNKRLVMGAQSNSTLAFFNPSVSANGSLSFLFTATAQSGTRSGEIDPPIIIPGGFDILITTLMGANGTITNISAEWSEI